MPRAKTPLLLLVTAALLAPRPSPAQDSPAEPSLRSRFEPLAFLVGGVWVGRFPDGRKTDEHRFEWALAGAALRDRHVVRGGGPEYRGETLYAWDAAAGRLVFTYWNSQGGVSTGHVEPGPEGLVFPETHASETGTLELRSVWTQKGRDAYETRQLQREGDAWKELWEMRFERQPAETALSVPDTRGRLAFNTTRDGNYEVYAANADGGEPLNLSQAPGTDWVYATAGGRIYLVSDRAGGLEPGTYHLYSMRGDGSELRQITRSPVWDAALGIAPDGQSFAICTRSEGKKRVSIIDTEGRLLTTLTPDGYEDCDPDWSPDGQRLLVRSNRGGAWDLWTIGVDGSDPRRLTEFPGNDHLPLYAYQGEGPARFSPDGRRVVWMADRDGDWDVYVMDVDGSASRKLTHNDASDSYPAWSPDGGRIAFDSDRDGETQVYLMNADGSGQTRVTSGGGASQAPSWIRAR